MAVWAKMATDVATGVGVGAISAGAELLDKRREAKARKKLGFFAKASTYVDYGLPLLGVIGSAIGLFKGDWQTRALTIAGVLAGRRATIGIVERMTTAKWVKVPAPSPGQYWKEEKGEEAEVSGITVEL